MNTSSSEQIHFSMDGDLNADEYPSISEEQFQALPVEPPAKRARIVHCKVCGVLGHYQKRCPQRSGASESYSSSARSDSAAPSGIPTNSSVAAAAPVSVPTRVPAMPRSRADIDSDVSDSSDDSEPEADDVGVQNDAILGAVEGEDVVDLTGLEWEVAPLPVPEESSATRSTPARNIESAIPRFTPGTRNFSGPRLSNCSTKEPKELFTEFFDDRVMNQFVRGTNGYARDTNIPNWVDIDSVELHKFFAILLVFGISCPSERRMAWDSPTFRIPIVSNIMSRTRFEQIMRAWHYINTARIEPAALNRANALDPFWTVEPLLKHICVVSQRCYNLSQSISIDEQCIPFKGRHKCRCYNAKKPEKWHLKVFALNDASNGYQWNSYLYRGKDEDRPPGVSATMWPCIKLTEPDIVHNKNHILYTDNWYTSLPLAAQMWSRGIHCVGTTKTNIRGAPKEHQFKKSGPSKKPRGEMKTVKTVLGATPLYYTAWMDKKPVHVLSTFGASVDVVRRNAKNARGQYEPLELRRPAIFGIYNYGMGGTDRFDQKLSYYRIKLRTVKWKRKVYAHMLNVVMVNIHILYRESRNLDRSNCGYALLDFQEMLIQQLGFPENEHSMPLEVFRIPTTLRRTLATCLKDPQRVVGFHEPLLLTRTRDGPDHRRMCIWCDKKKIYTMCRCCKVALCFAAEPTHSEDSSCFFQFHHAKLEV